MRFIYTADKAFWGTCTLPETRGRFAFSLGSSERRTHVRTTRTITLAITYPRRRHSLRS